ncbi:MAG: hypothetical protein JWM78_3182 [Verrucomicrobiaceae bacterium]|nr:hypothetical protein [Verrucomicrobiaceae bacterium]
MKWSDLRPAGNAISLRIDNRLPTFAGYVPLWVNSGTAALALSIVAARGLHPHIAQPEVILPGYGCPDLIAAAEFAGVRIVLADIGADDPGFNLDALKAALSANTIAVVAVNFLGIKERLSEIRELIGPDIELIEDDAQWFPEPTTDLSGDFICLSFGRGKPVSLLGGGALLIKDSLVERVLPWLNIAPNSSGASGSYMLKVAAYNTLLNPFAYGFISRNPFLKLGETRLKLLTEISALDKQRQQFLTSNVRIHFNRERASEEKLREIIATSARLTDVVAAAGERSARLLRYPVLCKNLKQRNRVWEEFRQAGLGVTAMYQKTLPEIPDVAQRVYAADNLSGAKAFSERLLTLPTHSGVKAKHLKHIADIVKAI